MLWTLLFIIVLLPVIAISIAMLMYVARRGRIEVILATHRAEIDAIHAEAFLTQVQSLEQNFTVFIEGHPDAALDYIAMVRKNFVEMYGLQNALQPTGDE